jgi:MFS transporter, DHA1 family, multidrug resistance protein
MTEASQPLPKRQIAITIVIVFLYWVSLYLFVPTLPVYVQSKVNDLALVGVILSMYGLWQIFARMPSGIVSDWIGWRRPDILLGLLLVALGAWVLAHAETASGLLIGRSITGIGAGAWVPMVVLFTSLFPPKDVIKATAILSAINSIGRIVGSASNGFLTSIGGYLLPFQVSVGAALLAVVALLILQEKRHPPQKPSLRKLGTLFIRRDVLLPSLLSIVLHYGDWTASFTFTPILAAQLGASNVMLSLLASLNLGMVLVGNAFSTAMAHRLGSKNLIIVCFVTQALGMVGAALAPSLLVVFIAQCAIGFAFGVGYPVLMGLSIEKVDHLEQNSAMGLHQSVYALGMFAGPWLSGILAKAIGIQPMFGIVGGSILVLGLLGQRALKTRAEIMKQAEVALNVKQ